MYRSAFPVFISVCFTSASFLRPHEALAGPLPDHGVVRCGMRCLRELIIQSIHALKMRQYLYMGNSSAVKRRTDGWQRSKVSRFK